MKTPSTLTLVSRTLRKLKAIPYDFGANFSSRNSLIKYAIQLLGTIPEEGRGSKTFKKNARLLFSEVFSGRSHSWDDIKPLFPYLGQDFIDEEILCNTNVLDYEKAQYVSQERLYAYYEVQSLTNLDFYLHYEEREAIVQWFKQLTRERQNHILFTRLDLRSEAIEIDEIIEYSEDLKLLQLAAEKVEKLHAWRTVFVDKKCFDPTSPEGKKLEKLAKHFHPELWILHEFSHVDLSRDDCCVIFKLITQYFGEVKAPQGEVRKLIAQSLSANDLKRVNFLTRFLD